MKKFVAGLTVVLGMIAGPAGVAHAAKPYPPPVKVVTQIDAPRHVLLGHAFDAHVLTKSPGANPNGGFVRVVITGPKGDQVDVLRKPYARRLTFRVPGLKPAGKYDLTSAYVGKNGSVFDGSRSSTTVNVVKPPKKHHR